MAEGFARSYFKNARVFSAGTRPAHRIAPNAVEVMKYEGIDISSQYPKDLKQIPDEVDVVIKMGCEVACPNLKGNIIEDWGIADPWGQDLKAYEEARDEIKAKVLALGKKLGIEK